MTRDEFSSILDLNVSCETFAMLEAFCTLVQKWGRAINLVSTVDLDELWHRHVLDSAQLARHAPVGVARWVDLGSGGGFPGIVVSVICKETAPRLEFVLVESDQRKATFLREVVRVLELNASVLDRRVDDVAPQDADIVSARALAPLSGIVPMLVRHMKPEGFALLMKGETYMDEVREAEKAWSFQWDAISSVTSPKATILRVSDVRRA